MMDNVSLLKHTLSHSFDLLGFKLPNLSMPSNQKTGRGYVNLESISGYTGSTSGQSPLRALPPITVDFDIS